MLCGHGAAGSVGGRNWGCLLAAAFEGAGLRVARDGRAVGGRGVESGSRGVPRLPIVPSALDRKGPALVVLDDARGQRGEEGGVQGGGDVGERVPAAGVGVSDVHDGLQVVGEGDCHGGVRA